MMWKVYADVAGNLFKRVNAEFVPLSNVGSAGRLHFAHIAVGFLTDASTSPSD